MTLQFISAIQLGLRGLLVVFLAETQ